MHNKLMSHFKLRKIRISWIFSFRINKINKPIKMNRIMKTPKIICNNKYQKRKKLVQN